MLPLLKLGFLLARTIAKPVANSIKSYAKTHPRFKNGCIYLGQKIHNFDKRSKNKLNGIRTTHIDPLSDEKAIDLGAEVIGETFIFAVAGTILVIESERSKRHEQAKDQHIEGVLTTQAAELSRLKSKLSQVEQETTDLRNYLQENLRPSATQGIIDFLSFRKKREAPPAPEEKVSPVELPRRIGVFESLRTSLGV